MPSCGEYTENQRLNSWPDVIQWQRLESNPRSLVLKPELSHLAWADNVSWSDQAAEWGGKVDQKKGGRESGKCGFGGDPFLYLCSRDIEFWIQHKIASTSAVWGVFRT